MATELTQERLRELLNYDPDTGVFTRRVSIKGHHAGSAAGSVHLNGYVGVIISGHRTYAHRLAFFYMTGEWPPHDVDHINRKRADNRWTNLRLATRAQNMCNLMPKNGGAYQQAGRWYAAIKVNGTRKSLGGYSTQEEAAAAYHRAASELRGEFARTA